MFTKKETDQKKNIEETEQQHNDTQYKKEQFAEARQFSRLEKDILAAVLSEENVHRARSTATHPTIYEWGGTIMAGGTWTTQNKVRPGVYMNFASEGTLPGTVGERGTVALALPLSWGQAGTILTVQAGDDVQAKLGYDWTAPQLLLIREALKRAQTLLLYRLNAGTKAKATLDTLTVSAQHGGVRGNDLAIVISANMNEPEQFDVSTLLAGKEVHKQTVSTMEQLQSNAFITFTGEGALTNTASLPLTGGNDGTSTNQEHADFLSKLEVLDFNTVGLISDDATLKSVYTAYIRRLRDTEGKKVQLVLSITRLRIMKVSSV